MDTPGLCRDFPCGIENRHSQPLSYSRYGVAAICRAVGAALLPFLFATTTITATKVVMGILAGMTTRE
jgi:hypothetical protein